LSDGRGGGLVRGDGTPGGTSGAGVGGSAFIGVDELPDGLVVVDGDGVVLQMNLAAERLTGVARPAAIGRHVTDVLPLRDADGRDWWKLLDPHGGLPTRSRQPERLLHLPGRHDLFVAARFIRRPARSEERRVGGEARCRWR